MSERRPIVILRDRLKRNIWTGIFALKQNQGQTFVDYVLLIVIVTASLLAMQVYMKRGIQGVIKLAGDQIADPSKAEVDRFKGTKVTSTTRAFTESNQDTVLMKKGQYSFSVNSTSWVAPGAQTVYRIEEKK